MSADTSPSAVPSIQEIIESETVLSDLHASTKVVRVGDRFAVKFGGTTSVSEAAALEYLSQHDNIPVPKFYASFSELETERHFVVMQYVDGITLEEALPTLGPEEKSDVVSQIRSILQDLRSIEAPGYLGSVNRLPYVDGVFYDPETSPPISGPFSSEDEMYAAIVRRFERSEPASYVRLLREITKGMPRHDIVFTHGDLQPKNIMLQEIPQTNGGRRYKVVLIDWEMAGWYPAYWEFCSATVCGRFKPEWLDMIQDVFPASTFAYEYLYMEYIRHLVFY